MEPVKLNFSHDLALAVDCDNYTPPPNVQIMERDLASLAEYLPKAEVAYRPDAPVWGWDRSFVLQLKRQGYTDLPTVAQLNEIRALSSRKTAVNVLCDLMHHSDSLPLIGKSCFVEDADCLDEYLGRLPAIMKEPLSGSGRGLRFIYDRPTVAQVNWARRCIRQQGGVVIEPYYDKVADFALEFLSTSEGVKYIGLSLFSTNANNVYSGNLVAPQAVLWKRLYEYFDSSVFAELQQLVLKSLDKICYNKYLGPLGVDMMVVCEAGKRYIHPCVEINFRRTMGEFSLHLAPLLAPGIEATFGIVFQKTPALLQQYISELEMPCFNTSGQLLSGTRILTPIAPQTQYAAVLNCCNI